MRRAVLLALLLVVPALAGCVGGDGHGAAPLDLDDAPPLARIEDPGGHVAGEEVVLEAAPVREDLTYSWTLGGKTYPGPVLRVTLEAGAHEAVLTVEDDAGVVHAETHAFEVAAATGPGDDAGGGDDGGDGSDDGEDDDAGTDGGSGGGAAGGADDEADCSFGGQSIDVAGSDFEYTFRFPWPCQPDSWEWDLGDGTRSREGSVTHQYRRDGPRTVTLTIQHDGGTYRYAKTVEVENVPLRIVPTVEGESVAYELTWGREVDSVVWDLGDGATSKESRPTHEYPNAGPWTVTAVATDAGGKTATAQRVVSLDAYPLRIDADLEQDTAPLSFRWGWTADTVAWTLPADCAFVDATGAQDAAATVRCDRPGIHAVRLAVAGEGRSATTTHNLDVREVPLRIHVEPDGDDGDEVTFTPVWHGELSDLEWDLGDGTTSTETSPTHAYRAYGTFPVVLTATGDGRPLTAETGFTVTDVPVRVDAMRGTGGAWTFTLDWVADPDAVSWSLGDGTVVEDRTTVEHAYASKGTYTVRVDATDGTHAGTWTGTVEVAAGSPPDWGDPADRPVRPGVQIASGGLRCTASFLFHEDWSRYFLATAAHCVGDPGGLGGRQTSPECDANLSFPLGTDVTFRDWSSGEVAVTGRLAYSSWDTMAAEGVDEPAACLGNDLALVEVDRADLAKVHPAVLHFGGPPRAGVEGARPEGSGVRTYGASDTRNPDGAVGDRNAANARGGQYLGHDGWQHSVLLDAPAVQGDSGAPLLTEDGDAIGVLSTVTADGTNQYTDLAKAVAWMEQHTDLDVALVTWDPWSRATPTPGGGLGGGGLGGGA